jgi:hypothetical protein
MGTATNGCLPPLVAISTIYTIIVVVNAVSSCHGSPMGTTTNGCIPPLVAAVITIYNTCLPACSRNHATANIYSSQANKIR